MRDGVRLALDVVLPASLPPGTRVPAVLTMTRYWRAEAGAGPSPEARFWVSHGYAAVTGDVRGTGASFGVWPHHRARAETRDFGEVIDWIPRQPWSDGRVVGWGTSYSANTADWMAERHRPALAAVVARFPDDDPYTDLYFPGGVPNAYMGRNWGLRVKALDLNTQPPSAVGQRSNSPPGRVRPVDGDSGGRLVAQAVAGRRAILSVWDGLQQVTYRDDRPRGWDGASMDDWSIRAQRAAVARSGVPIQS
jgi:putative CocE/NonD family hydrolase